jgi:pyrroloquinoline quinone (PQQ) biosynthesis protein C
MNDIARAAVDAPGDGSLPAADAGELIRLYETRHAITHHPFLGRLRASSVDLHHIWTLLANFQVSISRNFGRHLARITARVEDERVRSILAQQLADELGNGHPQRAHIVLFARMMETLETWRPAQPRADWLRPGHDFERRLAAVYDDQDWRVAVGAVMLGEVFGKQIDQFLADELRRQSDVELASLEWLVLHEKLEVEHAESSGELASFVAAADLEPIARGVHAAAAAGWAFLDGLEGVCYAPPERAG